jgi:hypothetical protein
MEQEPIFEQKLKKIALYIALFSLLLFVISLTQNAFRIDSEPNPYGWSNGFYLLILGWMGIIFGKASLAFYWLANPIYITAFILFFFKPKISFYLSLLATLLALSFLFCGKVLTNENGEISTISSYEAGYFLWVVSMLVLTIGSYLKRKG